MTSRIDRDRFDGWFLQVFTETLFQWFKVRRDDTRHGLDDGDGGRGFPLGRRTLRLLLLLLVLMLLLVLLLLLLQGRFGSR